jgi:hypothetical protein
MNKIKSGLLVLLVGMVGYAGEISFFVPADHEKYELIDSLCNYLQTLKLQIRQVESRLIRRDLRTDRLTVKCQFLRHQLKYNLVSSDKIVSYFNLMYNRQTVKTRYLKHLLAALEGDIRSKCYILWKFSRDKEGEIKRYLEEFTETVPVSVIKFHKKCTLSVEEPSMDLFVDEEYENPFQNMKTGINKKEGQCE